MSSKNIFHAALLLQVSPSIMEVLINHARDQLSFGLDVTTFQNSKGKSQRFIKHAIAIYCSIQAKVLFIQQ